MESTTKLPTEAVRALIRLVGEDPEREGLLKTPERYLKALAFLTSGYTTSVDEIIAGALFDESHRDMVIVRDIEVYSLCEHHVLPFYGRCHVGYVPDGKIVGLSKIARIVDCFARRLQVQERLTSQIMTGLMETLKPIGVGVIIEAYHLCMMMRGVQKQNSYTVTSSMSGCFRAQETRNEFLTLVQTEKR